MNDDYERAIRRSPSVSKSFERAEEIDIVITSFASEEDEHGMLNQFLANLIDEGETAAGDAGPDDCTGLVGLVTCSSGRIHLRGRSLRRWSPCGR